YKPTLPEVVRAVDAASAERNMAAPSFNIEIKSEPQLYGTFQPPPDGFAELVLREVRSLGIADRCILQSFDPAVLEAVHVLKPELPLALLVENAEGLEANISKLSFVPNYYSPAFSIVNTRMAAELREKGIGLLVWTVNEDADIFRMLDVGVSGIITDKPKRAMALIAERQ
ncbi:MAG: glycerophosphodiester phosphodiesterase family protein, partial [Flavobacteriales bacterium]